MSLGSFNDLSELLRYVRPNNSTLSALPSNQQSHTFGDANGPKLQQYDDGCVGSSSYDHSEPSRELYSYMHQIPSVPFMSCRFGADYTPTENSGNVNTVAPGNHLDPYAYASLSMLNVDFVPQDLTYTAQTQDPQPHFEACTPRSDFIMGGDFSLPESDIGLDGLFENAVNFGKHKPSQTAPKRKAKLKEGNRLKRPKATEVDVNIRFKCSVCNQSFKSVRRMEQHRHICTVDSRKYTCVDCGLVFNQACTLRVHKRKHTGERPFPCQYCGKMFRDNSCRVKHERTHTQEKKYACELCEYRSTQSGNLLRHKRTMH